MGVRCINNKWVLLTTAIAVLGIMVALSWNTITLAIAVASADQRPALLEDARWNDPSSSRRFLTRFQRGTNESELLEWLEANTFDIDRDTGRAVRLISSLPCSERVVVTWTAMQNDKLESANALVFEAGCL